jgi:hypothetical protein
MYVATNALYCKCFISRCGRGRRQRWSSWAQQRVRVGSEAGAAVGAEYKVVSIGVVVGVEHEATFACGQQARSTKLHPLANIRRGTRSCI